MKKRTVANRSL